MKRLPKAAAIFLLAALVATPALAGGNANLFVGQRYFFEDDVNDLELDVFDEHIAYGGSVDFEVGDWPVDLVGGLLYSSRDESDDLLGIDGDVSYLELSFGVRKTWVANGGPRPYVGGGLARVDSDIELSTSGFSVDADDDDFGIYGEGGLYWRIGKAFNLGWSVRALLGTELELEGEEYPSEYVQVGALAGWGWD